MAAPRQDSPESPAVPSLIEAGKAPAWMTDRRTAAVVAALEAKGSPGCARFVGGCVRDTIIGQAVADIDIATILPPDQVIQALTAAGLRWVPTGVEHGTVTAIAEGTPFEITTLRRDVATDGRRATVAFTQDWTEDAMRRDFRLNALYADPAGRLYDPTGGGVADARAGRIVFVGDAAARVREDFLRILRFFRFQAWYGRGEPDAEALAACAALRDRLDSLAAERVAKELLKLLAAPDPRASIALMAKTGVLSAVLPGVEDLSRFERLVALQMDGSIELDAELRLAALLPPGAARPMAGRLRLSNALGDRLAAAEGPAPRLVSWMSGRETRRAVYELGLPAFADRLRLAWAASKPGADAQWRAVLNLAQAWIIPSPPVGGADAIAAGLASGPLVGEVLGEVEAWWMDQDFTPDREEALRRMGTVIKGMMA